jgi:hypothetical protein
MVSIWLTRLTQFWNPRDTHPLQQAKFLLAWRRVGLFVVRKQVKMTYLQCLWLANMFSLLVRLATMVNSLWKTYVNVVCQLRQYVWLKAGLLPYNVPSLLLQHKQASDMKWAVLARQFMTVLGSLLQFRTC